jgi:hypothetical protein
MRAGDRDTGLGAASGFDPGPCSSPVPDDMQLRGPTRADMAVHGTLDLVFRLPMERWPRCGQSRGNRGTDARVVTGEVIPEAGRRTRSVRPMPSFQAATVRCVSLVIYFTPASRSRTLFLWAVPKGKTRVSLPCGNREVSKTPPRWCEARSNWLVTWYLRPASRISCLAVTTSTHGFPTKPTLSVALRCSM